MATDCARKAARKAELERNLGNKDLRPWDVEALQAYTGKVVLYVGEWQGQTAHATQAAGVTSSASFQAALAAGFSCVRRVPLPNWMDLRDDLSIWVRKPSADGGGSE